MGAHEKQGGSVEYYTPAYIFDAIQMKFDVDVAAPVDRTHCHVPARSFITENSLQAEWDGFVWMNPPFGNQRQKFEWINKFIDHGNGIALMPDRTSAPWWQHFAKRVDEIMFVDGKIKFILPNGSVAEQPGNGTTLFAMGYWGKCGLESAEQRGLGLRFNKIRR